MTNLYLNQFKTAMRSATNNLQINEAKYDPRLQGINLWGAEKTNDRAISGHNHTEVNALFAALNGIDHTNSQQGFISLDDVRVSSALIAIAEYSGADALMQLLRNAGVKGAGGYSPEQIDYLHDLATDNDIEFNARISSFPINQTQTAVLNAAKNLVRTAGEHYGASNPWVNIDPTHAVVAFQPVTWLEDVWKCNLFGGNVLYAAGFETPKYGNGTKGEYPNANKFYLWSNQHAGNSGNKPLLNLIAESRHLLSIEESAVYGSRNQQIEAEIEHKIQLFKTLMQATPGTMLTVDHPGDETTNGGHVRIVVENTLRMDADGNVTGSIKSAQAQQFAAVIKHDSFEKFMEEENVWVMQPNSKR